MCALCMLGWRALLYLCPRARGGPVRIWADVCGSSKKGLLDRPVIARPQSLDRPERGIAQAWRCRRAVVAVGSKVGHWLTASKQTCRQHTPLFRFASQKGRHLVRLSAGKVFPPAHFRPHQAWVRAMPPLNLRPRRAAVRAVPPSTCDPWLSFQRRLTSSPPGVQPHTGPECLHPHRRNGKPWVRHRHGGVGGATHPTAVHPISALRGVMR